MYFFKPASIKSRRINSKMLSGHLSGVGLAQGKSKTLSFSICFFFEYLIKVGSKKSHNFPPRGPWGSGWELMSTDETSHRHTALHNVSGSKGERLRWWDKTWGSHRELPRQLSG